MTIDIDNQAGFSDERLEAMSDGLERMSCPDSVSVVVSANFVADVRTLLASATYETSRGTSVVAAKTISVAADRQVIVVNANPVLELDLPQLARLLAHEAGHVLINSRGEGHLSPNVVSMGDRVLHSMAATALDEYRVELALYALGFPLALEVDWVSLGELAAEVNLEVMAAVTSEKNQLGPGELAEDIAAIHDWSSKKLAYSAAAVRAGALPDRGDISPKHAADWVDYVDGTWSQRLSAYRPAADASTPVPPHRLALLVDKLVSVECQYLYSMGFFYRNYPGTWGFHRRQDQELFDSRMRRALETVAELEQSASE